MSKLPQSIEIQKKKKKKVENGLHTQRFNWTMVFTQLSIKIKSTIFFKRDLQFFTSFFKSPFDNLWLRPKEICKGEGARSSTFKGCICSKSNSNHFSILYTHLWPLIKTPTISCRWYKKVPSRCSLIFNCIEWSLIPTYFHYSKIYKEEFY